MVPLAEMFGYANDLRSKTQGRAAYSMEFAHYESAPTSVANELWRRSEVPSASNRDETQRLNRKIERNEERKGESGYVEGEI